MCFEIHIYICVHSAMITTVKLIYILFSHIVAVFSSPEMDSLSIFSVFSTIVMFLISTHLIFTQC